MEQIKKMVKKVLLWAAVIVAVSALSWLVYKQVKLDKESADQAEQEDVKIIPMLDVTE